MDKRVLQMANDKLMQAVALLEKEGCSVSDDVHTAISNLRDYIGCLPDAAEIDRMAAQQTNWRTL